MSIRRTMLLSMLCAAVSACGAQDEQGTSGQDAPYDPELSDEVAAGEDGEDVDVGSLSQALMIGPNDVGVIAPAGMNCPNEHIMLTLENEREGNWNAWNGWLGAIEQDHSYTKLHFCRADGRNFRQARGTSTALNYAVLKLGNTCPAGSVEMDRYFDNEDRPRTCWPWPLACGVGAPPTIGSYGPSYYSANNLHMKLCMFRASPAGVAQPFPRIGVPYGVFGTTSLPGRIDSGSVHTDDEDDGNGNSLTGDSVGSSTFLTVGANTTFYLTEVNPPLPPPVIFYPADAVAW